MPRHCWAGSLLGFTRLDTGFLIGTDHPDSLSQQSNGVFIQMQDWPCPKEELLGFWMCCQAWKRQGRICSAVSQRPGVLAEMVGKVGIALTWRASSSARKRANATP